jgi:hypothetical protein
MKIIESLFAVSSDNHFIGEVVFLQSGQGKLDIIGVVFDHQDTSQFLHVIFLI